LFRQLNKYNETDVIPALKRAARVSDVQVGLYNEAYKIASCGDAINTVQCTHCGTNHFKSFVRCKSKFCALCQRVKSGMWTAYLFQWLKQWLEQGNKVVFLNLTIKDTDSLKDGLEQLEGAWRLMTGKRYRKAFLSKFPGGFKSIEVKTGKNSGQWHPHIHALVLKDKFSKDTDFLHYAWPKCVAACGGFAQNLKLVPFERIPGETSEEYDCRLMKSVREVAKYITKFDWKKETPERVGELFSALQGKRQYAVWGQLINVRHEVQHALDTHSDDECENFICQMCGCTSGKPNKLYKALWDSVDEGIIKDYKITMPEKVIDGEALERLKVVNRVVDARQKTQQAEWVQDKLDNHLFE